MFQCWKHDNSKTAAKCGGPPDGPLIEILLFRKWTVKGGIVGNSKCPGLTSSIEQYRFIVPWRET